MEPTPSVPSSCAQNFLEHGRAVDDTTLGVQTLADVNVVFHLALERSDVESADWKRGWNNTSRVTEAFGANSDDVTVWELTVVDG